MLLLGSVSCVGSKLGKMGRLLSQLLRCLLWYWPMGLVIFGREFSAATENVGFNKDIYVGHVTNGSEPVSLIEGLENILFITRQKDVTFSILSNERKTFYLDSYFANSFYQIHLFTRMALNNSLEFVHLVKIAAKHRGKTLQIAEVVVFVDSPLDRAPSWQNQSTSLKTSMFALNNEKSLWKLQALPSNPAVDVEYMLMDTDKFIVNSTTGDIFPNSKLKPGKYDFVAFAYSNKEKRSVPHPVSVTVDNTLELKHRRRRCSSRGGFSSDYEDSKRRKRSVRPLKEVELYESTTGDLIKLEGKPNERFMLKEPCPEMLDIDEITGIIKLKSKMRLDFEKEPELNFVVLISKTDDTSG